MASSAALGTQGAPVAGRDYPRSLAELRRMFPDEAACAAHLARLRWGEGFEEFACRRCGVVRGPWVEARGLLGCSSCQAQTSVTAGTVLNKTRTPLRT